MNTLTIPEHNELITIQGVKGFLDKNGTVWLDLEDVARGLGFTQKKNDVEYVRWETVRRYIFEFGFSQHVGKNGISVENKFIPENIFYRLAMKAKNEVAEKFQAKVADEILPSIRQHGGYLTPQKIEEVLLNPDTIIDLAKRLKQANEEKEKLQTENLVLKQQNNELKPKASYYDMVLQNKSLLSVSKIAKDYGMSARALNKKLHELGVQYKQGDIWLLYAKYQDKGYTQTTTHVIDADHSKVSTKWTQKGRLFIYELLKQHGILPLIEREKSAG